MAAVLTNPERSLSEAPPGTVLALPEGLPGFEQVHSWRVVTRADARPFFWLQSARQPDEPGSDVSLLLVDPHEVVPGYDARLSRTDMARVGLGPGDRCLIYVLVTLRGGEATANLRAPLVVNPVTLTAAQVILEQSGWSLRHRLAPVDD